MEPTTTAPSKRTVTDKLCDQALRRLVKRCETDYGKAFPHKPAGDSFFARMDEISDKLQVYLEKRPLTKAEINGLGERAWKALRAALREEAAKVKQPRYRECTHMDTGVVRLIPEYD